MNINTYEGRGWNEEETQSKIVVSLNDEDIKTLGTGEAFVSHAIRNELYGVEYLVIIAGRRTADPLIDIRKARLIT